MSTCVLSHWESVSTGPSIPWGLVEGSTENTTVVTDLLTDLRGRGLDTTRPILVGIDGGKALRAGIVQVFDHPPGPDF